MCAFQVNRIASLFHWHPATVYLVKDHNERAIFSGPSGSFSYAQVDSGSTYEVVGDPSPVNISTTEARPFGAFTSLSTGRGIPPPIHPPLLLLLLLPKRALEKLSL